ncbi:MAG: hypothetical protein KKA90_04980 [Nanoarchaeota archaeon]|nr:hypothetical protein [Nanoarchaeota archaeon]
MNLEYRRQLVHLSGILFVFLAQYTGRFIGVFIFAILTLTFIYYSEFVRRQHRHLFLIKQLEARVRNFAMKFERTAVPRPFLGAIWFYAGCTVAFVLFPLEIASLACLVLAVGDAVATAIGSNLGKHRLLDKKTIEGTAAFFFVSLFVLVVFVPPTVALVTALLATIAELLPSIEPLRKIKQRGLLDDNLLIPLVTGIVLVLV